MPKSVRVGLFRHTTNNNGWYIRQRQCRLWTSMMKNMCDFRLIYMWTDVDKDIDIGPAIVKRNRTLNCSHQYRMFTLTDISQPDIIKDNDIITMITKLVSKYRRCYIQL